jgi:hypothetical protein
MKKLIACTIAAAAAACAASAFAAPPAQDGVKDPETGITLHPPKHVANPAPGTKQEQFTAEVKAAMQRVASATKKAVNRADLAVRDVTHHEKS